VTDRPTPVVSVNDSVIRTKKTVTVAGQKIRVDIRPGTGNRTPLVLCNGIGISMEALDPFVGALDPELEVIRFDVPGVGGSPLPQRPYWMPELAGLLGKLLTVLGHDQVDMLGISWGGGLAQQYAVLNPRGCRRLVLVATGTGSLMVPARPRTLARLARPRRHRDARYAAAIAGELYGGSARTDPDRVAALLHADTRVGPRRGYLYQILAGWGWTSLPFLPLIRQSTLLLAGDDDPIIPLANARIMAALLPKVRLHIYRGGHLGLVTEAAQLAPTVDTFLTAPGQE
jgi:poly(3-hydroxyalkanoate) depolymerase